MAITRGLSSKGEAVVSLTIASHNSYLPLAELERSLIPANLQQLCGTPLIGCKSSDFLDNFSYKSDALALALQGRGFSFLFLSFDG